MNTTHGQADRASRKNRHILVVDDEPEIRNLMVDFLSDDEGYSVHEAENGRDALDNVLAHHSIDLVLSDINMPVMKGFELLKEVKERYPKTRRVLITAYNVADYLQLAMTHDIGNIFVKNTPFNFHELSAILDNLLSGDIFGLGKYFGAGASEKKVSIRRGDSLDTEAGAIVSWLPPSMDARKIELVLIELLANAVFYGIRKESPEEKEKWTYDFVLSEGQAITVTAMYDSVKAGISVVDPGGRLTKHDVLYWLNRQAAQTDDGVPLGILDTHGRGFYIAREYIDRLIINIDQNRKTEVIVLDYFGDVYAGHKPLYINEI